MDVHKEYTLLDYLNNNVNIGKYNILILVNSIDEFANVQKTLFKIGFSWPTQGKRVLMYHDAKYVKLFLPNKLIRYGFTDEMTDLDTIKIFTYEQFKSILLFNELS